MQRKIKMSASLFLSLALMLTLGVPALAQRSVTVPAGTVIPLTMDTYLSSETSGVGDRFTATVSRDVIVDGRVVVPSGAKVEGHVTSAERASSRSRAGTIGIAFDRLVLSDRGSIPVDGTLTSLDESARRQIENADEEDNVEGGSRTRRAIVFVGGGAGAGAVIGAVAGGGKGAAVGAGVGAVLGTIGVLLSKGEKAEVTPGTEFGMQVERSFNVDSSGLAASDASSSGVAGDYDPGPQFQGSGRQGRDVVFTSAEAIRSAQGVLRDRGFYNGPVNGVMTPGTRAAIRQFQRDRNLSESGELDIRTAQALGIAGERGAQTALIEIENPTAERVGRDRIRYMVTGRTRTGGYTVTTDSFVNGNTLHVYVRGIPPRNPASTAIDYHRLEQTVDNATGVTRVVFHGAERDITVDLSTVGGGGGTIPGGGTGGAGNGRQIAFLANRLLTDYARDLNLRNTRGQVSFEGSRTLSAPEVELIFHINSLVASAELYNRMTSTVTDPEATRGAVESLSRQVRLVNRALRRNDSSLRISSVVRNDWDLLRAELKNIGLTDALLDNDPDR
ncbi:MAG TPA: peptidoglycan-binding protein [Blastocatellia bacterium]|nr:peptidoglycan-binding protein [Blastocatellia bacterium]